jgi:hypothetical protein
MIDSVLLKRVDTSPIFVGAAILLFIFWSDKSRRRNPSKIKKIYTAEHEA